MKKTVKPISTKRTYFAIIAILSAATILVSAATAWISYPTANHREVAQELSRLNEKAITSPDFESSEKIYTSEKYMSLIESSENTYTTNTSTVSFLVSLLASAGATILLYHYLRRTRLTRKPVGLIVWFSVVTGLITYFPGLYISRVVSEMSFLEDNAYVIFSLIFLPFAILISALFTYVIAHFTDRIYTRSHGFIDD